MMVIIIEGTSSPFSLSTQHSTFTTKTFSDTACKYVENVKCVA